MDYKFDVVELEELNKLLLEYQGIAKFVKRHQTMNYVEFDYYTVNDLILFRVEPDFDFNLSEEVANKVIKALPAIKRIFSKPILHLKEDNQLLPVESVQVINNETIQHIANHSELWNNVKAGQIQPLKLMTKIYQDNYSIYENIVFCNLIDDVLIFIRRSIRFLNNLIYTSQSIEFNLLERVNHLNYFLALGKLHTGYIRNYDKFYFTAKLCLDKLNYIYNSIMPRLKSSIYKNNRIRPDKLKLRKTNVLLMHKDYHQIYSLAKNFSNYNFKVTYDFAENDFKELATNYSLFCQILSLFSIGHFSFACDQNQVINLDELKISFKFKNWQLMVYDLLVDTTKSLVFEVKKDTVYKVVLIPTVIKDGDNIKQKVKEVYEADEYLVCSPYDPEDTIKADCFLSIANVDSFRRINQILLKAMVYSDTKREDCPFCHNGLIQKSVNPFGDTIYECEICRTQIVDTICQEEQKPYSFTTITNLEKRSFHKNLFSKEVTWLYNRQIESQMYFRNITRINEEMQIVCPICNKVHA